MNQDIMHGKWTEIKGEIIKKWGQLTSDELEQSKGDLTSIKGLIQQKYGYKKDEASEKLDTFMSSYNQKAEDLKKKASTVTENLKKDLKN